MARRLSLDNPEMQLHLAAETAERLRREVEALRQRAASGDVIAASERQLVAARNFLAALRGKQ